MLWQKAKMLVFLIVGMNVKIISALGSSLIFSAVKASWTLRKMGFAILLDEKRTIYFNFLNIYQILEYILYKETL